MAGYFDNLKSMASQGAEKAVNGLRSLRTPAAAPSTGFVDDFGNLVGGDKPATAPAAPGKLATGLRYGGQALGVLGGGATAARAGADMVNNGVGVDNATDLAGGLALAGGSIASAPVATGAGAFLAGKGIGGKIAETILNPILDKQAADSDMLTPAFRAQVTAAGGPNKYVAGLQAPAATPAPAAPAAAPAAAPRTEFFAGGTPEAKGLRGQIGNGYMPPVGGGLISNNSTGSVTRVNPQPAAAGPEAGGNGQSRDVRSLLADELTRAQAAHAKIGNRATAARVNDLVGKLAEYDMKGQELGLRTAQMQWERTKYNNELGDKRMKDFQEQHVNNQFTTQKLDKDGKPTGESTPDAEKNSRFLDFMRNAPSEFYRANGLEGFQSLTQLPAEQRNQLVGELRKSFLEREGAEGSSKKNEWFRKQGLSDGPVSAAARGSTVGDIPQIGLTNYGLSKLKALTFGNPDVVDVTDRNGIRKTVTAPEYIGEGTEGSGERYSKLYKKGK